MICPCVLLKSCAASNPAIVSEHKRAHMCEYELMAAAGNHRKFLSLICLSLLLAAPIHAAWQSPELVAGATRISTREARELFDAGIPFIDVRSQYYYNKRHIPGVHHLDLKNDFTESNPGKIIGKSDAAVIYYNGAHCSLGYRASGMAAEWVFTNIYYYRAGFRAWRYAGNPIVVGDRIRAPQ
jgi:rhodanese-related sulfurtransferase